MDNIIKIKNLKKSFGTITAVNDISFKVKQGELFAFLGLNGAGKSTTINILVGVEKRDSGECFVDGKSVDKIDDILSLIGIVFQNSVLDKKLTVYDNLKFRAMLYSLTKKQFEDNLNFLTQNLQMTEILSKTFEKLSGGQKRKADIARALIHKPKVLILDEPTTGLDPKTRKIVWNLIDNLRKQEQLTVLLTTHYMEEATIADNVVILDNGKIVARGTPIELKNKYSSDYLKVYEYDKSLIDVLNKEKLSYTTNKEFLTIKFNNTNLAKQFLVNNNNLINDLEIVKGSMDDVFLAVTGKELKENVWIQS